MSDRRVTAAPPGFVRTVGVLLGASWKRAAGRRKRQRELLRQRARKQTRDWSWLGFAATALLMAFVNGGAAFVVAGAVGAGERVEAERGGKMVVSAWFIAGVDRAASHLRAETDLDAAVKRRSTRYFSAADFSLRRPDSTPLPSLATLTAREDLASLYDREARHLAYENGGSAPEIARQLQARVERQGTRGLVAEDLAAPGLSGLPAAGAMAAMLGSIVLLWWCAMVVFQGEGLELDLQRRRHPMWEWLFSHPVSSGAVFLAEMLSPIAANPIYCTVPLFPGFLYGFVYGPQFGLVAAFVVGVPVALAAACLGKAFEIAVILRFSPRSRGAMIGLMSWIGYASMMLFILGALSISKVALPAGKLLQPLTILPWPYLGLFLGQSHGAFSFPLGVMASLGAAALTLAAAVWFCVWGAQQGLSGNFGRAEAGAAAVKYHGIRFGRKPLYRKEILWFCRDRSAIVQTILVPLTVAGFQVFNLRGLAHQAQGAWNYLCGAGIVFGTYFLWILGPKSLASEGTALWIALTWPQGLESLLKAKAWLWSLISSAIVGLVLIYAAFLFPADSWKILLVGISWLFFGRSMAEKTVTLVRAPSESGEPAKLSRTRQWAASLGMLTFAMGVFTQHWHIAIMGIVYSYMTAAAMWENFRARLPFLYDPWSEKLPPPPTLMHAMIAISVLVEGGAVLTGVAMAIVGRENIAVTQTVIYGCCAVLVSFGLARFLHTRGVTLRQVWCWPAATLGGPAGRGRWWCGDGSRRGAFLAALLLGVGGGLVLGLVARGYLAVLLQFPAAAEIIHRSQARLTEIPGLRMSYIIMAVGFAPFAEEYLFRGLLFRALDREWGGWRAVVGSAAFFAIYHPVLSWPPVSLLGVANALLFKKTGRLAPAVVLHMVYNVVVVT
jgi:membrane protease YdiL (CAAX protease family)